jgi:hypothetical protein
LREGDFCQVLVCNIPRPQRLGDEQEASSIFGKGFFFKP